jgi:hypothetical protein
VRQLAPAVVAAAFLAAAACQPSADSATTNGSSASAPVTPSTAPAARTHLQIDGTSFRTPDGQLFQWRGITAFRLLDYVADGNEEAARSFLAWAKAQHLTVVRVLAMGGGFMDLKPDEGRAALSSLLEMAREEGLYVEVVALAGTLEMPVDLDEQLAAVGEILGDHPNALLEIANEPAHPSQRPDVGKPEVLLTLATRVPADVPVALGSLEEDEAFGQGDYATWHVPRESRHGGWGHALAVAAGADLLRKLKKPVISDEPIGAGAAYQPGRRDDVPARFRAAALLTRLVGMGATFHYEGGLQAKIPTGRELQCFDAWNEAWTLLPDDVETRGRFAVAGSPGAVVRSFDKASLGVFERIEDGRGWVLSLGSGDSSLKLSPGWREEETKNFEGARLLTVSLSTPAPRTSP